MTRSEAIEWIKNSPFYGENHEPFNMAIEALSVDAVEVVRCVDCKWHLNGHLCKQLSQYGSIETPPSFYCGFGERREL